MKRLAVLAVLCLALPSPTTGFVPVGLNAAERYLAYRVRLERGQSWYAMTTLLTRAAQRRAAAISTRFQHDRAALQLLADRLRCRVGEILATSQYDDAGTAVRHAIAMFNASPAHQPMLDNVGNEWRRYGVGASYAGGSWYFVVTAAGCT